MNKVLIFIAFFSFLSDSFSQNPEIIQLAQRITWDIHDDSLKVIAICHWMIDNISYDRNNAALNEYYKLKEQQKKTFDVFKDKESILLPLRKSKSYFEVSIKFYGKIYYKTGELNADNIKYDASKIKETDHEIEMIELYFKQTNRR